jgi:hypothetical protein
MRIVYRAGDAEHVYDADHADGMIIRIIGGAMPQEVAELAHNGTLRYPRRTTRDELAAAIRAVQGRIAADPGLLFAYACSVEALGDERPVGRPFARGGGLSGIRFPDTPADRAYALVCGPGPCDLEEMAVGPDGRAGNALGVRPLRQASAAAGLVRAAHPRPAVPAPAADAGLLRRRAVHRGGPARLGGGAARRAPGVRQ